MSLEKISDFAPSPIRIIAGIVFIAHGLPKFQNIQGTQSFFASSGIPPELVLPVGLLEVIGGSMLIVGLLSRITSILFIIEMIGVVLLVKLQNGLTGKGGYELDLLMLTISISLLFSGPGRISIERDLLEREIFPKISFKKRTTCKSNRSKINYLFLSMIDLIF